MSDVSYRYKASELAGRRAIQNDDTGEVTFVGEEVEVLVEVPVDALEEELPPPPITAPAVVRKKK